MWGWAPRILRPMATHLLNVRAENMTFFPDMPQHFVEWLTQRGDATEAAGLFASLCATSHLRRLRARHVATDVQRGGRAPYPR